MYLSENKIMGDPIKDKQSARPLFRQLFNDDAALVTLYTLKSPFAFMHG